MLDVCRCNNKSGRGNSGTIIKAIPLYMSRIANCSEITPVEPERITNKTLSVITGKNVEKLNNS